MAFVLRRRNRLKLHALLFAFGYAQRLALAFVALEEFRIVIRFAVDAFPGEQRLIAGRQAAQGEAPALIGDCFAIAVRTASEARFGHRNDHCVGDGFILLIGGDALGDRSIGACHQIERGRAATYAESRVRRVAARSHGFKKPIRHGAGFRNLN